MKTEQTNGRKIIITIMIFIFAFLIIFGSFMLTKKTKRKEKDLEISELNEVKSQQQIEENKVEDIKDEKEENMVENTTENALTPNYSQNLLLSNTTSNIIDNKTNSKNENDSKQTNTSNNNSKISGKLPVSNPNAIELCKKAQSSDEKNIYLTFDDGPSPDITPQILATLKKYDVPATFFVLGSRAELYPELLKQEFEEGHYIANHGYSHSYSSIYSSVQAVIDEYNQTEKAIQDSLGVPEYHTLLFRFPGGSSGGPYNDIKQEAKRKLDSMGIASTNWNCLNGDAEGGARTKEQLIKRLYETAAGWNSLVVLMHDANDKQTTADALPEIIEHYKAEGYTFKNYYDIFQ